MEEKEILEYLKNQIINNLDKIVLAVNNGHDICLKKNKENNLRVLYYRPKSIINFHE